MATGTRPRRVHALPMSTLPAETRFSGARRIARTRSGTNGAGRWRGRPAGVELRRAPNVAVMQATNFGNRDDRAERRWLDRPSVGCILVDRQVSASPVIVREVARQGTAQVPFAEDEDVLQALASDRSDEPRPVPSNWPKKKSHERIDGISALVNALTVALPAITGSVYDERPPLLVDL